MNKFKVCPECGTKNPPDVSDCVNCDCDLMSVPVTDAQQITVKNFSEDKPTIKSSLIRVCSECGEKNLPNARKCSNCGEDISDVIPTSEDTRTKSQIKSTIFVLRSLDDKITFKVDRDNIIIGREHDLRDYLSTKIFVSRKHCRFTLENGELFVEDLGSVNFTYVNNQRIFGKTKLARGDEVGLGGAIFKGTRQNNAAYFLVG